MRPKLNLKSTSWVQDLTVDLRKYSERLQDRLGDTKSADEIVESAWWDVVVRELNQMSVSCAKELQQETGLTYRKPAREKVPE